MRDPDRIARILGKFRQVWELYPDMRWGQLYINLMGENPLDPWQLEDDAVEKALDGFIERGEFPTRGTE